MKKVFNKKISIAYLFFILPVFFFLLIDYGDQVEDVWFLLAHGRYVINNGIPHTEILTLHKGLHFVMQQWAFSTILYAIYHSFGSIGVNILLGIINALIIFFLYKTCMILSKNNKYFSCIMASIIDLLLELNFIIPRPQIISLLLLIITLYLLEDYLNNNSNKIYFFPVVSIILINFHASIWPIMFIFCMPFIVEFLYLYYKNKDKRLFKLIIIMFISLLTAFINPYGSEALLYSFNSYGNPLIDNAIAEMHRFTLNIKMYSATCTSLLILAVIIVNLVFLYKNHKKYPIHYYFFLGGLSLMAFLTLRNVSFLLIGTLPFMVLNFNKEIKFKLPLKVFLIPLIIILLVYGFNCYRGYYTLKNTTVNKIVNYLDKNANKNAVIFTGFNEGSYFEYKGYKVYMDSRAEVFLKKNNHKEDIFTEYNDVYNGKADYHKFISKYKFTHIVVHKKTLFYKYLSSNNDYVNVCHQKSIYLYEKRDYSKTE